MLRAALGRQLRARRRVDRPVQVVLLVEPRRERHLDEVDVRREDDFRRPEKPPHGVREQARVELVVRYEDAV